MTLSTIALVFTVLSLLIVLGAGLGRAPLWVGVLLLVVAVLLMLGPSAPLKW